MRTSNVVSVVGLLVLLVAADSGCDSEATEPAAAPATAASDPAAKPAPSPPANRGADSDPNAALPESTPHFSVSDSVSTTVSGKGEGPYRFTATWHNNAAENWARVFKSYAGKPDLRYLEIGVFEGRSMIWMLENVLTHESSRVTAIDVFMAEDYEQTFDANIVASGAAERITKRKGPSRQELRAMSGAQFDFIYIDGSHTAADVLADAVLSWDLLKPDGLMIFDDYGWNGRPKGGVLPMELRPRVAVDMFLTAHRSELELVHRGYQIMVRKVENPCQPTDYCTPLGQYQYYWRALELRDSEGKKVTISPAETRLLEGLALSYPVGAVQLQVPKQVKESPEFKALAARLELEL